MAFSASWMDLVEAVMLSEVSQTVRPMSHALTYMWNLKKGNNELLRRTENDSQSLKNLWVPKQTGWGVGGCSGGLGWKCYKVAL